SWLSILIFWVGIVLPSTTMAMMRTRTVPLQSHLTTDSLIMGDEHLDTIPEKESNEFIKSSVEDLVPNPTTPDFSITNSLIMENEHLDTILETESDEFIKSSVENLVPIPRESEDFLEDECECDVPDSDDSQTTNFSTFSNPLFDDSTSSDDESSHEEVIHEISFKSYSNPLFDLDEEIISSEFNPIHNEDLDSTPKNVRFNTKSYLLESLLNRDGSIPLGIDCDNSDSKGHDLFLERLLHDDPIPLSDTLDFSIDVRVFLPFFTYLVTSLSLLSSGSEDTMFDPCIAIIHFYSFKPGVSHRCRTFKKFNTYRGHLNESPMEILSSTCSL
nr:hypothetical protein [Tanacetum cinerariifolium]